jgi:hypothetical protein
MMNLLKTLGQNEILYIEILKLIQIFDRFDIEYFKYICTINNLTKNMQKKLPEKNSNFHTFLLHVDFILKF